MASQCIGYLTAGGCPTWTCIAGLTGVISTLKLVILSGTAGVDSYSVIVFASAEHGNTMNTPGFGSPINTHHYNSRKMRVSNDRDGCHCHWIENLSASPMWRSRHVSLRV